MSLEVMAFTLQAVNAKDATVNSGFRGVRADAASRRRRDDPLVIVLEHLCTAAQCDNFGPRNQAALPR